jgi:hypothetical protein
MKAGEFVRVAPSCLAFALFAGCAHAPVDASRVELVATATAGACETLPANIPVLLTLRNASDSRLRFGLVGEDGPPYVPTFIDYRVLAATDEQEDFVHGPGGHGALPSAYLKVGRGDTTQLRIFLYGIDTADRDAQFRIALRNEDAVEILSNVFTACVAVSGNADPQS